MDLNMLPKSVLILVIVVLVTAVTVMGGAIIGVLVYLFKKLHTNVDSIKEQLGQLTPVSQHIAAYEKIWARHDSLNERLWNLESIHKKELKEIQ